MRTDIEKNLSVKKIVLFLNKLGLKLYVYRKPNSIAESYIIVDKETKETVFVGNYRSFLRWLESITKIYNKLFYEELYYEILKETGRLN